MKMLDEVVKIKKNVKLTAHLLKVSFEFPELARIVRPGHFLQIGVTQTYDPFLRRPFTVYRVVRNEIEILYEIVGYGSEILAHKKPGDFLKVMGPLGNTFKMNLKNRTHVVVGGGVGIAPFVFLGQKMRIDHFVMGARSKDRLLPKKEVGDLWKKASFATEDGSLGTKGYVTLCLEELIRKVKDPRKMYLYVCGPQAMMRAVMKVADKYGIDGEVSMEERMACGVGACLGCVVPTTEGYKTSCTDGTVFPFKKLRVG